MNEIGRGLRPTAFRFILNYSKFVLSIRRALHNFPSLSFHSYTPNENRNKLVKIFVSTFVVYFSFLFSLTNPYHTFSERRTTVFSFVVVREKNHQNTQVSWCVWLCVCARAHEERAKYATNLCGKQFLAYVIGISTTVKWKTCATRRHTHSLTSKLFRKVSGVWRCVDEMRQPSTMGKGDTNTYKFKIDFDCGSDRFVYGIEIRRQW